MTPTASLAGAGPTGAAGGLESGGGEDAPAGRLPFRSQVRPPWTLAAAALGAGGAVDLGLQLTLHAGLDVVHVLLAGGAAAMAVAVAAAWTARRNVGIAAGAAAASPARCDRPDARSRRRD